MLGAEEKATLYREISCPQSPVPEGMRLFLPGRSDKEYWAIRKKGLQTLREAGMLDSNSRPHESSLSGIPAKDIRTLLWIACGEQRRLGERLSRLAISTDEARGARDELREENQSLTRLPS